ncbi:E3 ubiquitin-protein ligase TRIM63-like [Thalassophryne amazonica]|uniref:E3 ubiquitin-protein ligase TRIM63-like n=1 Tax=Thalassophryne amazonica TaxID=390379 RepID=UPI00147262BC|nr:E3 ubiquitin-protein ligase TRIM63-like [Thalassophryne amazonica]
MESLEKQLICPICLEIFTKPVVILPCQHNLCRKCASDIFQASNPYLSTRSGSTVTSGGRFRCPSCRHEVVLDRHGVYGLQRNLLVENIIDMFKQGTASSKPAPEPKLESPMCEEHDGEKLNIYCVTCGVPTCSLCKVFGGHKDCEVAPLNSIFQKQKAELTDCISLLVGNNERTQAVISQLEETCRAVDVNGRRQKSKVCEMFDHLFAILEDRKGEMTLRINAEQEEKLDYIRGLRKKYKEHLDATAKLLETAIQTMEESEMVVFLQAVKSLLQKIVEGTNTSHLDKVQRGYESMDHFTVDFEQQKRALMNVDFVKSDEDDDDEEDEVMEGRGTTPGKRTEQAVAAGLPTNQLPSQPQQPPQQATPKSTEIVTPQTKSQNSISVSQAASRESRPTSSPAAGTITGTTTSPTTGPIASPTAGTITGPNARPTAIPTAGPITGSNARPIAGTTVGPTNSPTAGPTTGPTNSPTAGPANSPTAGPTNGPTACPTNSPTAGPTTGPTNSPAAGPANSPTAGTTAGPTTGTTASPSPSEQQSDPEDKDGPRHVFSFTWLNQK